MLCLHLFILRNLRRKINAAGSSGFDTIDNAMLSHVLVNQFRLVNSRANVSNLINIPSLNEMTRCSNIQTLRNISAKV